MARIDWVHARLENWAIWVERTRSGGLGYATQSSFLTDPADRQLEARLPIDEVEASITDEGVCALLASHSHLHRTIELMYLVGSGIKESARAMSCAESTVHARLGQGDQVLATWFADRKRRKADEAETLRQQIEAARPAKLATVLVPPARRGRKTLRLKA